MESGSHIDAEICGYQGCSRTSSAQDGHCVLHSDDTDKDPVAFRRAISEVIRAGVQQGDAAVFSGVVFPEDSFDLLAAFDRCGVSCDPRNLEIKECKFPQGILLRGSGLSELHIHGCSGSEIKIEQINARQIKLASNELDRLQISQCRVEYLFFGAYEAFNANHPQIRNVFMLHCECHRFQMSHTHIEKLHVAGCSVAAGTHINGGRHRAILIRDTSFSGPTHFEELAPNDYFVIARCPIREPRLFSIVRCDLSKAGFNGTDLTDVHFSANNWRRTGSTRVCILDHQLAIDKKPLPEFLGPYGDISLNECAETYRQLKTNFENRSNYIDAGAFHFCDLELRRLSLPRPWRWFSIYSFYRLLSGYGEQPVRATAVFAVALCILAGLHLLAGFSVGGNVVDYTLSELPRHTSHWREILQAAQLAFSHLTLRSSTSPEALATPVNTALWMFETIFGPLQLGLIALTIKRRVRR